MVTPKEAEAIKNVLDQHFDICRKSIEQWTKASEAIAEMVRVSNEQLASFRIGVIALQSPESITSKINAFGRTGGVELAMEITGKSRSHIYNLVSEGKIPHGKNGGRLVFRELDLRMYAFSSGITESVLRATLPVSNQEQPQQPE